MVQTGVHSYIHFVGCSVTIFLLKAHYYYTTGYHKMILQNLPRACIQEMKLNLLITAFVALATLACAQYGEPNATMSAVWPGDARMFVVSVGDQVR
jgi:hypothetical protein